PDQGIYVRPCSASLSETNEMREGYTWTEAYYLSPIGYGDITAASPTREIANSNMYQNINWSAEGGQYALK
ncbi:MAG: RagB/SusD family nutrient uptake outer membrane protein, partial [Paramuribaculum sp.]|nr:RagB/SusD family nutrient uptake outer membrane protein [Paramuribaculum sp.]